MLARLQGREDAVAFASGVAALAIPFLGLLQSGDHVILFVEGYMPSRYLIREFLKKFGVTHTLLFYDQVDELQKYVKAETKLIFFESPTNPSLVVADIAKIVAVAKANKILTMLDNTLAGFHQHGEWGVDIYAHSLTKYASGHGDVMGGVAIASKEIIQTLKPAAINIGSTLDPHTAFLILRGMKTYFVRYERQCATALAVAKYLSAHDKVKLVRYPGLESHPDHSVAKKQMKDFGALVFMELKAGVDMKVFFERLKYFKATGSLGSTESLIIPCRKFYGGDLAFDQQERARLTEMSVRLSIGLESARDLIQDLELALM
jgi:cystathionine beta-lyase/cystathionine gamma-synthase